MRVQFMLGLHFALKLVASEAAQFGRNWGTTLESKPGVRERSHASPPELCVMDHPADSRALGSGRKGV